jgi:CRP-like cAMP-binding protein
VLFDVSSVFAVNYIKFLSDRVAFLNRRIDSFTAPDAEKSLARFICLNATSESEYQHEVGVKNYSEVAQRLNIGRASLYRAFEALEDEGLISKDGKTLKIRNFELLQKRGNLI